MYVKCKQVTKESDVFWLLYRATQESRFTATLDYHPKWGIKYHTVRLKRAKLYCGQHPGPCVALFPRPHRMCKFLEGLDWVGLNQLVNDVLDKHKIEAAVWSFNRESLVGGRYYIRRGTLRRVEYPFEYRGNFAHWTQGRFEKDFEDHCGKPPPETPWHIKEAGTPGYPCYTLTEEEEYLAADREAAAEAEVS